MKMVVAHVFREAVEPIRADLRYLTVRSLSVSELNPRKVKLECVVGPESVSSVVGAVLRHARVHSAGGDTVSVEPVEESATPCRPAAGVAQ